MSSNLNIAVLNFGGLGDNILFIPVINALCQLHPEAEITWITETRSRGIQDLLPPQVTVEFISIQKESRLKLFFKLRHLLVAKRFDAVISSGSSPFISVMLASTGIPIRVGYNTGALSQMLLTKAASLNLNIYASEMHFKLVESYATLVSNGSLTERLGAKAMRPLVSSSVIEQLPKTDLPEGNYIAIHPGVSLASIQKNMLKGWAPERWCALTTALIDNYPEHKIILLGGPDDKEIIDSIKAQMSQTDLGRIINYSEKTDSVAKLASVLLQVQLLVCVDSAPMHLAVALKTPIVPLFAPTDPFKLLPRDIAEQSVRRRDLSCQPCLFNVRKTSCDTPMCLDITVKEVLSQIQFALL